MRFKPAPALALAFLGIIGLAAAGHSHAAIKHYRVEIPRQPLDTALNDFAAQTGLRVDRFSNGVKGYTLVGPVSGSYSAEQALEALLAPSGVAFKRLSDRTYVVVPPEEPNLQMPPKAGEVARSLSPGMGEGGAPPQDEAQGTSGGSVLGNSAPGVREEVVVTGSRIRRDSNLTSPSPLVVVDSAQIEAEGQIHLANVLNQIPGFSDSFTIASSAPNPLATGLQAVDLRRLGIDRTLVLVNGRRHIAGQAGSAAVDISTIPQELIERVEVVTGGASAVYGADAVAGVVNFILKDDFEGISLYSQAGENSEGNYSSSATRLVVGNNFADDRGNFVLSGEYATTPHLHTANSYIGTDQRFHEIPNPADGDTPGFNDGIPDFLLGPFPGQESTISKSGMFRFVDSAGNLVGAGGPGLGQWIFNGDGSLRPWDYGFLFLPDDLIQFGGDGLTLADLEFNLRAAQKRYSANALLNYDLTDSLRLFAELKYVDTRSTSNRGSSPRRTVNVGLDNAFWSPQALQFLADNDVQSATISRYNRELGIKQDKPERNTFRGVLGTEGDLTDSISFEFSYAFGRSNASLRRTNNLIIDRFTAGVDAVRDPATGEIVCRSTIDGNPTGLPDFAVNGCVPVNILGVNTISDEAVDWLMTEDSVTETLQQEVISLVFNGDTSALFSLAGGPVGWAIGGEYRREDAASRAATVEELTGIVDRTASSSIEGSFDVGEVFGELSLPLLAGKPFFERLEIDAAARLADYSTVGENLTWSVGLNWALLPDIRFRATYAEAVRAPNIGELFAGQSGFLFHVPDPCDRDEIVNGTQFRATNCAALGIPPDFNPPTTQQFDPLVISGGNPDLLEEKATSWTVGAVFTPSFLSGLSISADYWNIQVDDVIAATSSDNVAARCVDAPSISNSFCPLITRDPSALLITQVITTRQNLAAVETSGVDFQVNYGFGLGEQWGRMDLNLVGTWLDSRKTFPFQEFPDEFVENQGVLGDPEWLVNFDSLWRWNRLSVNYELRYMSHQLFVPRTTYEVNPDGLEVPRTEDDFVHDIRAQFDLSSYASVFAGVDNIADEKVPCCVTGGFNNSAQFDNIGRYYYGGFKLTF